MHSNATTDDDLDNNLSFLWDNALSKSTLATYSSALSSFLTFLAISGLVPPWPQTTLPTISEHIIIQYVAYCQKSLHLRYDSIKLYLAGIRFHYIKRNNFDVLKNNLQLQYILRSVKKTQQNVKGLRLPITFSILSDLCFALSSGMLSPFLDLMYSCVFTTAFYGFLRCGEFTCTKNSLTFLQLSDIIVNQDHSMFTLRLRTSKTDPFGSGVSIPIFNSQPLCPVTIMAKYLAMRRAQAAQPDAPLFIDSQFSTSPLARSTFITSLRCILARIGYNDSHFSGHSFRIGACTSGAAGGVEDHLLQVLGRWKSGCYTRYIHTQLPSIRRSQQLMNSN